MYTWIVLYFSFKSKSNLLVFLFSGFVLHVFIFIIQTYRPFLLFSPGDEISRTTLTVLICFLSTLLVTTWLLVAIFAFLKRRRGRLHLNETHGAVDIRLEDQEAPHHYDDAQDIDKCYT